MKNRCNLTPAQKVRLAALESLSHLRLKTVRAYRLRESFQGIYGETTKEGFERLSQSPRHLRRGYCWATHSRPVAMSDAAKTMRRHWAGVVCGYDSRIGNGILEGLNRLVRAAKAKARGDRTFKNFKTMIYLLLGKLDYTQTGLPVLVKT